MNSCPGCGEPIEEGHSFCVACGTSIGTSGGSTAEYVAPEDRVGTVRGNYELLRILGAGGMGTVYEAEHVKLGRRVALKMLHAECCGETLHRFFGEARAVNAIAHENIIDITDFVEDPEGGNFYVMEHLQGRELEEVMKEDGVLPLGRSLRIAAQVASTLHAVHDAGIVHRDLKPANVFLIERGTKKDFVKVLDFGVAKFTSRGILMQQTASGVVVGTPFYMSPEQIRGDVVDHRLDIYAFGVILYQLVAGCSPFDANSFGDLVILQATQDPLPPSQMRGAQAALIPPELDALILQCLAREPDGRPESMAVVEAELHRIIDTLSPEAATDSGDPSLLLSLGDEEDEFSSDGSTGMIRQRGGSGTGAMPAAGPGGTGAMPAVGPGGTGKMSAIGSGGTGKMPAVGPGGTGAMPAVSAGGGPTGTVAMAATDAAAGRAAALASPPAPTSRSLVVAGGLLGGLGLAIIVAVGVWYATQSPPSGASPTTEIAARGAPGGAAGETIELRFRSTPAAEVYGDGRRLGRTPFATTVTSSGETRTFEFKHDGRSVKRTVTLNQDLEINVSLTSPQPTPAPEARPARPTRPARPQPDRDPPTRPKTTPVEPTPTAASKTPSPTAAPDPPTDLRDPWSD